MEKELDERVKVFSLYENEYSKLSNVKKMIIPIKLLLFSKAIYNKIIRSSYDTEIAFLEGPVTRLFCTKNNRTSKVVWVHNDIEKVFGKGFKARVKRMIDNSIYKKYSKIVFVSNDNMQKFKCVYPDVDPGKMSVIYNYLDCDLILKKSNEYSTEIQKYTEKKFVSVCRLVEQKGIDRLIRVHKKLLDNDYRHLFFIVGEGPDREKIELMIKKYGIEKTFILLGQKENPYPYMKEADYFCLLSYFEGYGMVLDEAKVLKKKIIITNTAARESLKDYKNGIILENDEESIYKGMMDIIKNDSMPNYEENFNCKDRIEQVINLIESC